MVDLRIYRASFVVSLIALLVVMFSLQERPAPLASPIAPDAFKGERAYGDTSRLAGLYPDREPGSIGDERLGDLVESRFRGLGLQTSRDHFTADWDGEEQPMSNVVGVLDAPSDRQVVVMAPRDAAGRPGASSASSTAVLLQLAQALDGSSRKKTFVLVSLDGGAAAAAGAKRFAAHYPHRDKVDAVLVVDEAGAVQERRPFVVPWSTDSRRPALQVVRTAEAALAHEAGSRPRAEAVPAQFLREAWPLSLREQGPLVARGLDGVTLTSHGEVPPGDGPDTLASISPERLQTFGRAAFETVLAYDGAQSVQASPRRYIAAGRKVMPDWAFALLAVGLTLPAVIAAVDAFARARRRGLPIGPWVRWALAPALPFALVFLAAFLFGLAGWLPDSPAEALAPATRPSFGEAGPALLALVLLFGLGWVLARPAAVRRRLGAPGPPAAVVLALLFSVEVLLVCVVNPFTALVLVPAAHLCLLASLPESPRRGLLGAGALVGGAILPLAALVYYGARFDLGGHVMSYPLLLVESAVASPWTAALVALVGGTLASAASMALKRGEAPRQAPVTVRGPTSYAGPGSLGGTESALRR